MDDNIDKLIEKDFSKCEMFVNTNDLEEYFAIPRKNRTRWGFWYLYPLGLPCNFLFEEEKESGGWSDFSRRIRKEFPVQGWLREYFFSFDNPIYAFFVNKNRQLNEIKYKIKYFFSPSHKIVRKAFPRDWVDIQILIEDLNLAMIEQFYKEAQESCVDWEGTDVHRKFYAELKKANNYVTVIRPRLIKKINLELAEASKKRGLSYEETYGKHNHLESLLERLDERYIVWAVKNRGFFWT